MVSLSNHSAWLLAGDNRKTLLVRHLVGDSYGRCHILMSEAAQPIDAPGEADDNQGNCRGS